MLTGWHIGYNTKETKLRQTKRYSSVRHYFNDSNTAICGITYAYVIHFGEFTGKFRECCQSCLQKLEGEKKC